MRFKKIALILPFTLVLSYGQALATTVTINQTPLPLDSPPIVQAGRVFIPLRGIFEALGAEVVYDNGTINATRNETEISLDIGSTIATISGSQQNIDSPPFIIGATTYVPLRFIAQALGDDVSYDNSTSTVEIAYRDSDVQVAQNFTPSETIVVAPPPLPVYYQPPCPASNYLWVPGVWAWGNLGYYWVPGTWVPAPAPNMLWTPGYWHWHNGSYAWNSGYWGPHIGFYGGINYGFGYYGSGFVGGGWSGGFFHYNMAFLNVNTALVPNVYMNVHEAPFYGGYNKYGPNNNQYNNQNFEHTTIINNHNIYVSNRYVSNRYSNQANNRVSFAGGPRGIAASPNSNELRALHEHHIGPTQVQQQHRRQASKNRNYLATVNNGHPADAAVVRPMSESFHPAHFAPINPHHSLSIERRAYTRGPENAAYHHHHHIASQAPKVSRPRTVYRAHSSRSAAHHEQRYAAHHEQRYAAHHEQHNGAHHEQHNGAHHEQHNGAHHEHKSRNAQ